MSDAVKKVLVSFIVPVLNGEKDIGRCLLSIQNQLFPSEEFEVLVLDNGSTDKTHQIVADLGRKIEVIAGVTVAALRNRGATLARGAYLAFVDADVELTPDWLKEGLVLFKNPQIIAVGCFPRAPQPATWVQKTWEIQQRGGRWKRGPKPIAWLPSMNLLLRRDAFVKVGGFNEQLETAEDVDLCYRLGQHGSILCNPAMEATHWGEATNLRTFLRKEIWRGAGNLKGVSIHGLRWDELPSLVYPLYFLCFALLTIAGTFLDLWYGRVLLIPLSLAFLGFPALLLALKTAWSAKQSASIFKLFILYFLYGFARAYAVLKILLAHSDFVFHSKATPS